MWSIFSLLRQGAALSACLLALALPLAADPITDALNRGDVAGARAALEAQVAGRADADLHRMHLEGMIALRQGDYSGAATHFRAVLARDPNYEPARLQLADTLARIERAEAASDRAPATTEDQRLRDALLAEIAGGQGGRDWGVALRFSILPSSNITGGTDARVVMIGGIPFTLDAASRRAAGTGLSLGFTAWQGWTLGQGWRATVSASADRRIYDTGLRDDETEIGLRLDLSRRTARSSLTFGPRLGLIWQDGVEVRRRAGLGLSGHVAPTPRLRLSYALDWAVQDYPGASHRNGSRVTGWLGLRWRATPRTTLTMGLPMERETANRPHLSHRDLGVTLGVEHAFKTGLSLGLEAAFSDNRYDGAYPVFGIARRDRVTSLRLSLSHDKIGWQGLTPEISVTRERQDSNIPLHATWTTSFGLSLVKRF